MKIVYVITSLATQGGTERIIAEKANYFAENFGYDVTIICYIQETNTSNFYTLSDKVKQVNLGVQFYSQYKYKYPKRLWMKYKLRTQYKKALTNAVLFINPDILIGITHFRSDSVCSINCKAKKIVESHIPRKSIELNYENRLFIFKLYKQLYDKRYHHILEKKADVIISLTNDEYEQWSKAKRIKVIPDFSTMVITQKSNCKSKRVIAVGRLRKEKGYDRLIDIWKSVSAKHSDWQLDIFGEGILKDELLSIIKENNVKNIFLQGVSHNISQEYATSSICAVTSYFEGFSLVILEAMKHGVPCVAFDCPEGPKSIIEDGENGLLVENGNKSLFSVH